MVCNMYISIIARQAMSKKKIVSMGCVFKEQYLINTNDQLIIIYQAWAGI